MILSKTDGKVRLLGGWEDYFAPKVKVKFKYGRYWSTALEGDGRDLILEQMGRRTRHVDTRRKDILSRTLRSLVRACGHGMSGNKDDNHGTGHGKEEIL